jgi:RNA polymerase sigma factor (sigma-70 family)
MSSAGRSAQETLELPAVVPDAGPSDETLLALFAMSDPDGSAAFIRRFERRIFGLARTIVGDSRAAEDVAQEALLKVWRHADAFDARRGGVATWVMTIARNVAIDAVRSRRSITVAPDDLVGWSASDRDPADVAVLSDDTDRLRAALMRLPDEQRRAVVLAGVWGITAREIAERDGIPLGTAKTRIRIALTRLREMLRDDERTTAD